MNANDTETSTSGTSTKADRYKLIWARDIKEAETQINALAREGYKFLAFQSVQDTTVIIIMEMDIDTLMDEVRGGGGFMSQG